MGTMKKKMEIAIRVWCLYWCLSIRVLWRKPPMSKVGYLENLDEQIAKMKKAVPEKELEDGLLGSGFSGFVCKRLFPSIP